jgi:four helix bundle protein
MARRTSGSQHPTSNIQHPTSNGRFDGQDMYDLEERLLDFSARISRLSDKLPRSRPGNHVANQILRSGTSPLSNHGEAQAAESNADFLHKMKVCLKELRETYRWLRLIHHVPLVKRPALVEPLIDECDQLIRIFYASIRTASSHGDDQG